MNEKEKGLHSNSLSANEEKYCEEVQAIVDRMPTSGVKTVAVITTILIFLTILMGFLIKYSDSVDGEITITSLYAPVKIVSKNNGNIHLLKQNNDSVRKGEPLAWFDNAARYNDVVILKGILASYNIDSISIIELPEKLELGELSNVYSNFVLAHKQYIRFIQNNVYETQLANLKEQIKLYHTVLGNIEKEIGFRDNAMKLNRKQNIRDSLLFIGKAITEAEMMQRKTTYLSKLEAYQNLQIEKSTTTSNINSTRISITQLQMEENDRRETCISTLLATIYELNNSLMLWEQKYVLYAPIDGIVEYLGFWRENAYIQIQEPLFSIIPKKGGIIGEVIVPVYGIGKVKIGQNVNVKLNNFPYDEYGSIYGRVEYISQMTKVILTQGGNIDAHLVRVSFPNGATTNFGKDLELNFETKGSAEIITKPKKLIHRLFDNLKYSITE